MTKFIVITFLILGWAFYELSGGADFEPERRIVAEAPVAEPAPQVTRAASSAALISLTMPARQLAREPVVEAAPVPPVIQISDAGLSLEAIETAVEASLVVPATEITAAPVSQIIDLRQVAGQRVNMRAGPGTNFTVVTTLERGTEAEVMEVNASGWAQVRIPASGQTGWMAVRLLTDS